MSLRNQMFVVVCMHGRQFGDHRAAMQMLNINVRHPLRQSLRGFLIDIQLSAKLRENNNRSTFPHANNQISINNWIIIMRQFGLTMAIDNDTQNLAIA